MSFLHGVEFETLLDVGSGRGVFLLPFMEKFPEVKITSLDLLEKRVTFLNESAAGGYSQLTAMQENLCSQPFPENSFDVVTLLEVLEHIPEVDKAIATALKMARQYVVVTVPSKPYDNLEHIHLLTVEALTKIPAFASLSGEQQKMLSLAAALRDVGKYHATRMEDGAWVSPNHSSVGAHIVRQFLWQSQNLCGSEAAFRFREGVCSLIRRHDMPAHAFDQSDGVLQLAKFAESPATVEMVCLLAEADILGRIASDSPELMEKVQLSEELAKENDSYHAPMTFASPVTKRAWFSGRNVHPSQALYDDNWGEVIQMNGLPGTGKDTWIQNHCDLPMISLDEIHKEWRYDLSGFQTPVVKEARRRARELLRKKAALCLECY